MPEGPPALDLPRRVSSICAAVCFGVLPATISCRAAGWRLRRTGEAISLLASRAVPVPAFTKSGHREAVGLMSLGDVLGALETLELREMPPGSVRI